MDFFTFDKSFVLDNFSFVQDKKCFVRAEGRGKSRKNCFKVKLIFLIISLESIELQTCSIPQNNPYNILLWPYELLFYSKINHLYSMIQNICPLFFRSPSRYLPAKQTWFLKFNVFESSLTINPPILLLKIWKCSYKIDQSFLHLFCFISNAVFFNPLKNLKFLRSLLSRCLILHQKFYTLLLIQRQF